MPHNLHILLSMGSVLIGHFYPLINGTDVKIELKKQRWLGFKLFDQQSLKVNTAILELF